jgi:hypothetical protein
VNCFNSNLQEKIKHQSNYNNTLDPTLFEAVDKTNNCGDLPKLKRNAKKFEEYSKTKNKFLSFLILFLKFQLHVKQVNRKQSEHANY